MRYVVLALLFTSQVAYSQTLRLSSNNLRSGGLFNLAVTFNPQTISMPSSESDVTQFLSPELRKKEVNKTYISPVRTLMANDFFFNGSPLSSNLGGNAIMMGQTVTNSFNLGGLKGNVRYVFDTNGNLVDHEFSIPLKKKKRGTAISIRRQN